MKPLALDICCGKGGWAKGLIAEGWRVISLRCGELSEIVLRRRTLYLTVVARNSIVNTVHMFDTAN